MNVIYLHQHFNTREGAGGSRSYEFAKELVRRGHSVTVICGAYQNSGLGALSAPKVERVIDGIKVIALNLVYSNKHGFYRRIRTFFSFAVRSAWLCVWRPCDVLLASSTPLTVAIPALVMKWIRRTPFVFEVRDVWPDLAISLGVLRSRFIIGLARWLELTTYRHARACIALAPGARDAILSRCPTAQVTLIPNCSDLDLFQPDPSSTSKATQQSITAIFAGTHGLANGLGAVLDAARVLRDRQRRDIKLLLVGDGSEKAELQERSRAEGLNCEFLSPIPKAELPSLFRSVEVGLMVLRNVPAFYSGTSPNKFFDYLAAGLPVLVNHPGWIADLVLKWNCGLSVSPDHPEAFASALEYLADHPSERTKMAKCARILAESQFDRKQLAADFAALLEHAASTGERTA